MRWKRGRRSKNVEDRRGIRGSRGAKVGGGLGALIVIVLGLIFGVNPNALMQFLGPAQPPPGGVAPAGQAAGNPQQDELADFVSVVLADTEDTWTTLFNKMGKTYRKPKLVLFSGSVKSACGLANSAVGPFYCPADQTVYIDLSFYRDLKQRHHAPGDFAQAYVIAHEIGHHVQNLLGTMDKVDALRGRVSREEMNQLSVRLELQADFYAGVWAHHAQKFRNVLEPGDIDEALTAASAIGDDRLQREARGYVTPDSFTHGTSAQRVRWFRRGFTTGDLSQGDTFAVDSL